MDRSSDPSLDEARTLYTKFAGRDGDDAIRAMADIALWAKRQQTGWGRLRLEALRELGRFLIRNAKGQGRPAKTSAGEVLPTLAGLGITDHHISADAKNVARVGQRDFDGYLAQADEPTLAGLLRFDERNSAGVLATSWTRPSAAGRRLFSEIDDETSTTEWMTPPEVFNAMATEFDIDVASPGRQSVPWIPAKRHLTKREDGLSSAWAGFVWMNPPYGLRNGMLDWIEKFIEHGNGVALVPDFTSTDWWQTLTAASDAILFVKPKIQFLPRRETGTNTLGSTLVAIGIQGIAALQHAERNGRGICFRRDAARIKSRLLEAAE
jgi:hypothetical protein